MVVQSPGSQLYPQKKNNSSLAFVGFSLYFYCATIFCQKNALLQQIHTIRDPDIRLTFLIIKNYTIMKSILLSLLTLLCAFFGYAQNVGVGTTAPETILHVAQTNTTTDGTDGVFVNIQNTTTLGTSGSLTGIRFRMDGVGTPVNSRYKGGIFFEKTGSFGVGSLHFLNNAGGNNNSVTMADAKMTIASNGYVGIGTTTPALGRLQVEGPTSTDLLHVKTPSGNGLSMSVVGSYPTLGFNTMLNSGYKFIGNGYAGMFQHSTITGDLSYYSSTATGTTGNSISFLGSFFTLDAAGRLGLSTTAPTAKLHVNGNMVIGSGSISPATGYSLSVDGKVICEEARVQISGSWPDYVFNSNYRLKPIDELEKQVKELNHLPGMPAAAEVEKEGFDLGNMNKKLLEKVEELTLYIIALNKKNELLTERVTKLEKK